MNCWLVYLNTSSYTAYSKPGWETEHLGIAYLAAAARRAGYDVHVLDAAAEGKSYDEVFYELCVTDADFVGFSVTCCTIVDAISVAERLKTVSPRVHICFGGQHATFAAEEILRDYSSVDSVVRGYGEETLIELLDALRCKKSFGGINGVCYREAPDHVCINPDRMLSCNLDQLPFPSRGSDATSRGVFTIHTSRGCVNNCGFCTTPTFNRIQGLAGWSARSASSVLSEIEQLCEASQVPGPVDISFVDDNLFVDSKESKERIAEIAYGLIERGLNTTIWFMVGAFTLTEVDRELLCLLRKAGFQRALLGIEAVSAETLGIYGKPTSQERNWDVIRLMTECGYLLHCMFILFHPYATMPEVRTNARFVVNALEWPSVGFNTTYCSKLMAFPGTAITNTLARDGLLIPNKPYLDPYPYRFVHPEVGLLAEAIQQIEVDIAKMDWLIFDIRTSLLRPISQCGCEICGRLQQQSQELISCASNTCFDIFMEAAMAAEIGDVTLLNDVIDLFRSSIIPNIKQLGGFKCEIDNMLMMHHEYSIHRPIGGNTNDAKLE